jgi:hypothetical protein
MSRVQRRKQNARPATTARAVAVLIHAVFVQMGGITPLAEAQEDVQASGEALQVEICEVGLPRNNAWPDHSVEATERFRADAFALFRLPLKYNDQGVRDDRANPLLVRATATVLWPAGSHHILLRSRRAAKLWVDGQLIAENCFPAKITDGHDPVERPFLKLAPGVRFAAAGDQEKLVTFRSSGRAHSIRLEVIVGGITNKTVLRPELGETSVAISYEGAETFWLVSPIREIQLTDDGWLAFISERSRHYDQLDRDRRQRAQGEQAEYWRRRHEYARQVVKERRAAANQIESDSTASGAASLTTIDSYLAGAGSGDPPTARDPRTAPRGAQDDFTFLRRVYLDTTGMLPSREEIETFMAEEDANKRARLIDHLLKDPRWADHWVGYWQDALAENPTIINPTLNNTGPFRWWIYESFFDNKPLDRFVTELVMMSGSPNFGGPAGFSMASQNDVPMAAKANILATAFLGTQMKCSRCHDAPYHSNTQEDLFSIAAMLEREPVKVPASSTVPQNKLHSGDREPLIKVSLQPGTEIKPRWPFETISQHALPPELKRPVDDTRSELAWRIVSPHNRQFASTIVNRLWHRMVGSGLVEPVDDWEGAEPSHPELLEFLADEFVEHDYDIKHIAKLILNSAAYQQPGASDSSESVAGLPKRRMTAEQLVDSLFAAFGKPLHTEELNLDITSGRPWNNALNLGTPRRAWQFAGMANNRDRPSLTLPRTQAVVDVMEAFGWRSSRQEPTSQRTETVNVLQPANLANGPMGRWLTTLSDDHAITDLCCQDQPLTELIAAIYLRVLTRNPTDEEAQQVTEILAEGYEQRRVTPTLHVPKNGRGPSPVATRPPLFVTWANHLEPEATTIKLREADAARHGDPATQRLDPDWRQRMEDVLWAMLNLPETIHY